MSRDFSIHAVSSCSIVAAKLSLCVCRSTDVDYELALLGNRKYWWIFHKSVRARVKVESIANAGVSQS